MDDATDPSAITFVLGSGRCGSTLVADALSLHPDVSFVSNYYDRFGRDFAGADRSIYQRRRFRPVRRRRMTVHPSEGYRALARQVSPLLVAPPRDLLASDVTPFLEARIREFVRGRQEAHGASHFLHKFTGWPRARLLAECLPHARFIHVVRDGRAVANSMVQQHWWSGFRGPDGWDFGALDKDEARIHRDSGGSFPALAGLQWSRLMRDFRECEQELQDSWWTVRYEDFIADPAAALEAIRAFCGLPPARRLTRNLRRIDISRSREAAYRRDLGPEDLRWVEVATRVQLEHFGYEVDT